MILMRFLNRVHYNLPMSPLELEMHHQIRNIIGINPIFYDFLLQIDADTVVAPDSATRFVGAFMHDTRLIGVCGETALSNAKSSIVTMMQVYEYYISVSAGTAFAQVLLNADIYAAQSDQGFRIALWLCHLFTRLFHHGPHSCSGYRQTSLRV